MKYIPADKLITEIERQMKECVGEYGVIHKLPEYRCLKNIRSYVTSLQQEPRFQQYDNIVDKIFGAGNLEELERDEAEMLVALAKEELLKSLQQNQQTVVDSICSNAEILAPYKDGNQWCILKGDNIQAGVVGFGDTKEDALVDFIKNVKTPQEPSEVDLEKEIEKWFDEIGEAWENGEWSTNDIKSTARHFYELGKARKEEKK